mgnify:CR=1 FL=1
MTNSSRSPKIESISWGTTRLEDGQSFKDVKLWPGGARAWDWNETGTSHRPGIQPDDVKELVQHGAKTVVLSRGMSRRLQVKQETLDWLEKNGVKAEVMQTEDAVEEYNRLADSEEVGALIHSTC